MLFPVALPPPPLPMLTEPEPEEELPLLVVEAAAFACAFLISLFCVSIFFFKLAASFLALASWLSKLATFFFFSAIIASRDACCSL